MDTQTMWVDSGRCTGCGACVEVCPTGAMTLLDGKAHVDENTCIGCGVCADECPQDAIQPVVQGELILAPERSSPAVYRPSPLTEAAGAAVAVAGAGLLVKTAGALARAVGRWLTRWPATTGSPLRQAQGRLLRHTRDSAAGGASQARGGSGGGRRARRRRRGR